MPRLKRLSLKNKKFARAYIKNNGDGAKAALETLDAKPQYAKNAALAQLDQPLVQAEIERLLDKAGLDLDTITGNSREIITKGMEAKPTFAAAVGHLEFIYKAHGVSPVNKSLSVKLSGKQQIATQDITQLTNDIKTLKEQMDKLLTLD
jgi:hypothetical protein